jgi:hypothetical protein
MKSEVRVNKNPRLTEENMFTPRREQGWVSPYLVTSAIAASLRKGMPGAVKLLIAVLVVMSFGLSCSASAQEVTGSVAYFKLDEGAGVAAADSSGNGNNGTLFNNPTWTQDYAPTCNQNQFALNFNGTQRVTVEDSNSLHFDGDFSGAVWVKTTDQFAVITEKDIPNIGNPALIFIIESGHAAFIVGLAGLPDFIVFSNDTVSDGNWHHLAFVRRGDRLEIYLDGQLNGLRTGVPSGSVANGERLTLGGDEGGLGSGVFNGLTGTLDDFQLFNRALSASEIQTLSCQVTNVQIDIKPGSFPNSINLGSNGTVSVAIFSTATFDATQIDPLTVTLASAPVKLKGNGTPQFSNQDVDGDGLLDLVVHVSTSTLQLSETDTEAVLEGETFSGKAIRGKDTIRVVP